jgi:P27 family predicted phage terminase small subunit
MTRGPRPIPTHLKLLRGNTGKRPLNKDEPQPEAFDDVPDPPSFVTGYAAEEWWRTAAELHGLGLLTKVDVPALAAYCYAFGQWKMAVEALERIQSGDPVMNGMLIKGKYGNSIVNPLVSVVRKHAADVVRYAAEFGLTPAARSRISGGIRGENPQGKFAGLLAG